MSQNTLVCWMRQTCSDPPVPGELLGMALLEELPHGATRVGGTKPAEPALAVLHSSPVAFPIAKGWSDWESHLSEKCQVSSPALNLLSLASCPSLEKMSQEVEAMA
ncbi:hypothetical protein WISP_85131 [Willisornis vidua]|uniref:Uncharacterized protein n=1 Tax=Willisornis vidua TaxID=1566151 RepID=A0ABQ9D378_9PASS|nr:hypothetical protein WISP_85131 [Willisornis vidua]